MNIFEMHMQHQEDISKAVFLTRHSLRGEANPAKRDALVKVVLDAVHYTSVTTPHSFYGVVLHALQPDSAQTALVETMARKILELQEKLGLPL